MVRRHPSQDSQGQPADPAQPSDRPPLASSNEGEIALFTIPDSARGAKVRDVRHAERLRLPDLDLTLSTDLQTLAATLRKGEPAGSDLPLQAAPVPDQTPIDRLELAADDPGLKWFDDEAELEHAHETRQEHTVPGVPKVPGVPGVPGVRRVPGGPGVAGVPKVPGVPGVLGVRRVHGVRRVLGVRRVRRGIGMLWSHGVPRVSGMLRAPRGLPGVRRVSSAAGTFRALGLAGVRRVSAGSGAALHKARAGALAVRSSAASMRRRTLEHTRASVRRAASSTAEASARLAASARQSASAMPLDEMMRGALFTAALVAIVVVLARFDWTRPGALPVGIVGAPTAPDASAEARSATPARALDGQAIAPFARLAPSVAGGAVSAGGIPEAVIPEPVETVAAGMRRDTSLDEAFGGPVVPAASRAASTPPVQASTGNPVASVAARDLAPLTPIVDPIPRPRIVDAVPAGGSPADAADAVLASAAAPAEEAIAATLDQLEVAYERRDANLARTVWPTVDIQALARAFDGLKSQRVEFDGCRVTIAGATGEVQCQGTTTYVPRVGSQYARTESREWVFRLEKGDERWVITRAAAR